MSSNEITSLVVGANGMLGQEVTNLLKSRNHTVIESVFPETDDPNQHTLDITDVPAVDAILDEYKPDVLFNCSAYTDVDAAETNEELASAVNGTGVGNLARACKVRDILLVHVSTDYVFNGTADTPYKPDDPTDPAGAYGRTKLLGELEIAAATDNAIIVRTSWLFGPCGKNFVQTIVGLAKTKDQLKVVNDQKGCPTYAPDLAKCLADLAEKKATGIYHFSNQPECTWYDFAKEAVRIAGHTCQIDPCTTDEFPRPAQRPAYSVMDCTKTYQTLGWSARSWQDTLVEYLKNQA